MTAKMQEISDALEVALAGLNFPVFSINAGDGIAPRCPL